MKGSFFVALATVLVLSQGADAAQSKKVSQQAKKKTAATSTLKTKKTVKPAKASQSAATVSASESATAPTSAIALPKTAASTSKAKMSTVQPTLGDRVAMDFYNFASAGMRAMNTAGDVVNSTDNYVGLSYKLTDTSKVYIRQQYGFNVPGTGAAGSEVEGLKLVAEDVYLRYQNSKLLPIFNDGSLGGRLTVSLPTGEPSRNDPAKAHHGKVSARAFIVKPVNKIFSWDYLIQAGYNARQNMGVRNKDGELKGTGAYSYAQILGMNFEVGQGFTLTQSVGTTGGWTNETEEFGVEQSNNIDLSTYVSRSFGPATVILGVNQNQSIMPDSDKRWEPSDFMNDETSSYYMEFVLSI